MQIETCRRLTHVFMSHAVRASALCFSLTFPLACCANDHQPALNDWLYSSVYSTPLCSLSHSLSSDSILVSRCRGFRCPRTIHIILLFRGDVLPCITCVCFIDRAAILVWKWSPFGRLYSSISRLHGRCCRRRRYTYDQKAKCVPHTQRQRYLLLQTPETDIPTNEQTESWGQNYNLFSQFSPAFKPVFVAQVEGFYGTHNLSRSKTFPIQNGSIWVSQSSNQLFKD